MAFSGNGETSNFMSSGYFTGTAWKYFYSWTYDPSSDKFKVTVGIKSYTEHTGVSSDAVYGDLRRRAGIKGITVLQNGVEKEVLLQEGLEVPCKFTKNAWRNIYTFPSFYIDGKNADTKISIKSYLQWRYNGTDHATCDNEKEIILKSDRGLVHLDNGTEINTAIPYIDSGTEFVQAIPYIDNGSTFTICS